MNLDQEVMRMEVFYDGRCAMCRTFVEWLVRQEGACEVVCLDYDGDDARRVFPDLGDYDPEKEMVVRVDGGDVYQGAEGWVYCLWGCVKYRDVAERMSHRLLLPMAKKVCYLVSKNRLGISRLFFRKKNEEIAAELEKAAEEVIKIGCEGGCE